MKSFLPKYISELSIPLDLSIILDICSRAQGKEDLWEMQKPEVLNVLREQAIISSSESSNRIEGVEVEEKRIKPLLIGKAVPRDRSEEEVVGYKNALVWIHEKHHQIEINSDTVKHLHYLAQEGSISDAGQWKNKNNEIIEITPDGQSKVRFIPTVAKEVPTYIKNLCLMYNEAVKNSKFPSIILVATFIFDFLCIHPFRDGNGRVSRLLALLLLYQHNFKLGKYISIERIIEETKEDYYSSLKQSSINWHQSSHNLLPFWQYFARTVKIAYDRLGSKFQVQEIFHGGKTQLIRNAIMKQVGNFKLSDIVNLEKSISRDLIQKVLNEMKSEGLISLYGRGRGAYWKRN